jgi:hypothetical protein
MIASVPEITCVCQVECGAARFGTIQKKSDGTAIPQTGKKNPSPRSICGGCILFRERFNQKQFFGVK